MKRNSIIRPATRADGRPAYLDAKPRLRQSDIDNQRAWAAHDVRRHYDVAR